MPSRIVVSVATSPLIATLLTMPLPASARYITPFSTRMPSGPLSTRGVWICTGAPALALVACGMRYSPPAHTVLM